MLEAHGLDVFYGDLQALWQVTVRVEAQEIVALIGPNGAGKTTLLRAIAGLQPLTSGEITFEGRALHHKAAHRIVEEGIALVPEGRRLFAGMSVLENLQLGAFGRRARQQRDEALGWVFEVFPVLAERQHQAAGTMSGGEQQMLAIGRALMARPRLLLLDEPSLGLAPIAARRIFDVIRLINAERRVSVLLVEQNVKAALELSHRAYLAQSGRIVGHGSAADLLADERVKSAYLDFLSASG
ncbi:MAG: ABC transporter ATP-binding protein [Candidatus Methylomirabilaceae bacterium]